jgi:MSHA biogenesis protein MshQ
MNKIATVAVALLLTLAGSGTAMAAVCTTNAGAGTWATVSTWSCGHVPVAADSVVISRNITGVATTITGLTVNAGITLADGGNTLNITGDLTNNGTITGGGRMNVTGAASVISGTGTYSNSRLYTSGAAPTIPVGAVLNFTGSSRIYTGRTAPGANALTSVLTINGTINSTVAATTAFLRLYATSTVVGITGVINASVSAITYNNSTAKLTNNGSVNVNKITRNSASNAWTQGNNSSLTVSAVSTVGILYASNTGNTVTYTSPASPMVPNSNTYYNLAGSGVICPITYIILGTSPCVAGTSVTSSPTSCSNTTGVGTIAWVNPLSATASDNVYATAANVIRNTTTNYLNCTGFNFSAVPAGATITGITVYVERKTSGGTLKDAYVYLIKAGTISTAFNGLTTTAYTTADAIEVHGGMTNLWATTWTDTDVKAANFGVAFAAKNTSTTSTTNRTVSVDHIQVRIDYTATSTHHVSISAPNVGSTCSASNITIAAHTSTHTAPTSAVGTIRLTTSDSKGDWAIVTGAGTLANGTANDGLSTYAYATGETSVTLALTHTNAGTITIGVADNTSGTSLLTNTPAPELANSIAYAAGGFTITDSAGVAIANLTQTAGLASPIYYLKATSAACGSAFNNVVRSIDMAFECNDPIACQSPVMSITNTATGVTTSLPAGSPFGTNPATATYSVVSLNFNASSLAPLKMTSPDVGKMSLYFRYTASSLLSESNPFVVKPSGFTLSNIKRTSDGFANPIAGNASGTAFVKAGEAFTASVTAVNAVGAATPNYGHEVVPESVKLTTALAGLGLTNAPAVTGSFAAFTNAGVATGTAFKWDEVGIIKLTPSVGDADYLGVGEVTGTTSGNIGRFTLGKFDVQNITMDDRSDLCQGGTLISDGITPCPPFTYMGEEVDAGFTLVPMSLNDVASQNYVDSATAANDFAKLDPSSYSNLNLGAVDSATVGGPFYLTPRITNAAMPVVSCATAPCFTRPGGVGSQAEADVVAPFAFSRGAMPDGAYSAVDIGIALVDSDGATVVFDLDTNSVAGNDHALLATTEFRYGRSKLSNAHGSELLSLVLPLAVEYWDATTNAYTTSVDDSISVIAVTLGNYLRNLNSGETTPIAPTITNGTGQIGLSKPGANNNGSVDVTVSSPSYLPGNTARATFGVYKGNNELIYMRENY